MCQYRKLIKHGIFLSPQHPQQLKPQTFSTILFSYHFIVYVSLSPAAYVRP